MFFSKKRAKDTFKSLEWAAYERKCRKRVDVAQKRASGCPNLGPKGANIKVRKSPGAFLKGPGGGSKRNTKRTTKQLKIT